jgi:hypothetical protein
LYKLLPGTTAESFIADLDILSKEEQGQRRHHSGIVEIGLQMEMIEQLNAIFNIYGTFEGEYLNRPELEMVNYPGIGKLPFIH